MLEVLFISNDLKLKFIQHQYILESGEEKY